MPDPCDIRYASTVWPRVIQQSNRNRWHSSCVLPGLGCTSDLAALAAVLAASDQRSASDFYTSCCLSSRISRCILAKFLSASNRDYSILFLMLNTSSLIESLMRVNLSFYFLEGSPISMFLSRKRRSRIATCFCISCPSIRSPTELFCLVDDVVDEVILFFHLFIDILV